jgi:Carboxypeptidase regulatory-like domain
MISIPTAARATALAALLAVGSVGSVSAQSRSSSAVRGTVTRTDGTPMSGAEVSIRHEGTGTSKSLVTNLKGHFIMTLLQPGGPYTLRVRALGYAERVLENIQLQVGETATLEVVLTEQALAVEGVTVEVDRTEVFNPGQVGPATRLSEVTLEAMPILSRDITQLAVLSPLVTTTEGGGFSVLGQNDRYNALLIDGIPGQDAFGLTANGVPGGQAGAKLIPMDAIAQYEVLVAPFDVRLSGFSGGVMNAVTRTGTNDFRTRIFGVHRAEALMGDLVLPTGPVDASGVNRSLIGASFGGPIVRDRGHFFISGEFERRNQPPTGFNLGRDDPGLVRVSPSSMARFQEIFESQFGLPTGDPGPFSLGRELTNIFSRIDWNFAGGDRFTVKNVFARAASDQSPNRSAFQPYELSSNGARQTSTNNSTQFQYFLDLGGGGGNETNFEVRRSSDATTPVSDWPQVEVDLLSSIQGAAFTRGVRTGGGFFAQDNDLTQTIFRFTNSTTLVRGTNTRTFGVTAAYYDFSNRFTPGGQGDWFFADTTDLKNNAPQRYQRTVIQEGADAAVDFSVAEWGAFVQSEMDAGKGLTMRFGLRVDVPYVIGRPGENPGVLDAFGVNTSHLPSGNILWSPRWGFNWQGGGDRRTQVRGGMGVFSGQIPFVWLANAFHNDGLREVTNVCRGRWTDDPLTGNTAPKFNAGTAPTSCLAGDFTKVRSVVAFDEDFRYPQNFRFSAAIDQELSSRLSMTLGFLFNHAINQVALVEQDLGKPEGSLGPLKGYGELDRRFFGIPDRNGFRPNKDYPEFSQVLVATNASNDLAFSLTAELRGQITDRVRFQSGYTYSRAQDRTSLTANDMVSNYGFNAISGNPNAAGIRSSNFERPHKVVLAVFGSPFPGLEDTELSLLYTGQSGLPYSYVYDGDLNGDGYPGVGGAFDRFNDLVYVPFESTDIPAGIATYQLLGSALENDACLRANKGRILLRNACRAPWQNRLDLRISHTVRTASADLRFEADMINVLNLVNSNWGAIYSIQPNVALLEPVRVGCRIGPLSRCAMNANWAGAVLPGRTEDGRLQSTDPWSVVSPDSQWQAQFGVRVTFGRGR